MMVDGLFSLVLSGKGTTYETPSKISVWISLNPIGAGCPEIFAEVAMSGFLNCCNNFWQKSSLGILKEHETAFREASDVVVAGTSAGVYGITLNLDLISEIPNVRLVLDSIWRDAYQRSIKTPPNG